MRRAANTDNNQTGIVDALRSIPGVRVEVGHDDILVGRAGKTFWFEVKNPERVLRKDGTVRPSEITDSERKRLDEWTGHYEVVWSLDQILASILNEPDDARVDVREEAGQE